MRKLALFQLECSRRLLDSYRLDSVPQELLLAAEVAVETEAAHLAGVAARLREVSDTAAAWLYEAVERARGKNRHFVRKASLEAVAASLAHTALSGEGWWRVTTDIDDGMPLHHYMALEGRREGVCQDNIALLRCIVGNPFRPVAFDPRWHTEHTVGIARKMYDDRDFAAMPMFADALEEAGCDVEAVLSHCRDPGPHARGCWVVDGVLGKR